MATLSCSTPEGWRSASPRSVAHITEPGDNIGRVEAAFFDLDKTIIARSGSLALSRSFLREGLIGRGTLLKSMYAQLVFQLMGADEAKMDRMRAEAAKLTAGWEVDKVRTVVAEVLEEVISPLMYAEALALIEEHEASGRLVCIVSSSPEEVVEPLAKMLHVDRWIATKPEISEGLYTGVLDFYCYGPHKAEAMRELARELNLDLQGSFSYSDSITDLPMLEVVGHPVAVNPDRELRKVALQRGWQIEWFRNPVQLRDRLPHLRRPEVEVGVGFAAAGAVLAAVAVAWWVARRNAERID
jgi:HAD superfamily hydrolase (TIGR01490 family)